MIGERVMGERVIGRGRARPMLAVALAVSLGLLSASCGSSTTDTTDTDTTTKNADTDTDTDTDTTDTDTDAVSDSVVPTKFPDVVAVEANQDADGTWTFAVTLSSPYDTPERYADAWRVAGVDGEVYGIRELTHDHQSEQPFTRSKSGIAIPEGVDEVIVEGRDQLSGWGGETIRFALA